MLASICASFVGETLVMSKAAKLQQATKDRWDDPPFGKAADYEQFRSGSLGYLPILQAF